MKLLCNVIFLHIIIVNNKFSGCPRVREGGHLPAGQAADGGARGPGVFFVIPCVDQYEKIDMRTKTYEIPPQEVCAENCKTSTNFVHYRS